MISISALTRITSAQLISTFNHAFSYYIVPVNLNSFILKQKMAQENIRLEFSAGVFDDGRLVGLMLHGIGEVNDEPAAYNGGTGIIPEYRGRGLVSRMYDFLKPLLEQVGIQKVLLEVIDTNERAISAYKKVGFRRLRMLDCFKGEILHPVLVPDPGVTAEVAPELPWAQLPSFWNYRPTWQHTIAAARRGHGPLKYLAIKEKGQLLAYGIVNAGTGRAVQYGVHPAHRRRGLGRLLFNSLASLGNPRITVLNVDGEDEQSRQFFQGMGFECYVRQLEMEWRF